MASSLSDIMKKRNQVSASSQSILISHIHVCLSLCVQLMWKLVASEEDYVSQLTILNEEYREQFEIAAASRRPPLTFKQSNCLFRNRYVW